MIRKGLVRTWKAYMSRLQNPPGLEEAVVAVVMRMPALAPANQAIMLDVNDTVPPPANRANQPRRRLQARGMQCLVALPTSPAALRGLEPTDAPPASSRCHSGLHPMPSAGILTSPFVLLPFSDVDLTVLTESCIVLHMD